MNIHKIYFQIIFLIIREQNEYLLNSISSRENIHGNELKEFLPSKKQLKKWINSNQIQSSESSSVSSSDSSSVSSS